MLLWSPQSARQTSFASSSSPRSSLLSSSSSLWSRSSFLRLLMLWLWLLIMIGWLPSGDSLTSSTRASAWRTIQPASVQQWRHHHHPYYSDRRRLSSYYYYDSMTKRKSLVNQANEEQQKEQSKMMTNATSSALTVATFITTPSMVVAGEPAGAHPLSSSSTATTTASPTMTISSSSSSSLPAVPTLPTYKSLWIFTCTTMLIWLSEPMLSLVDMTVVGMTQADQMAAVIQLAALGPATMLIDASAYVAFFLGIATTNQLAVARAKNNVRKCQTTTSQVLGVAVIFGMAISMIVFGFGRTILTWMAGQSATPELLEYSLQYCYIRAAVAPIAIMGLVAQSVCLADLDTMTPGYAVIVASLVNVVGDVSLVPTYGIAGAALATAVAGVTATMILMIKVRSKMKLWRQREVDMYQAYYQHNQQHNFQQQQQVVLHNMTTSSNTTTNALVNGTTTNRSSSSSSSSMPMMNIPPPVPLLSFPDRASFAKLVKLSGPIFFVMLGKIICYSAMTLRATNFGILALAGHNIMMRIYWFMACFGDSLGQTAQSYLPSVLFYPDHKWRRQLIRRLFVMAVCIGLGVSQFAKVIVQHMAGMFTKDVHIIQIMSQQSTWMAFSLLLDPFIMLCEGCIIATRDLRFLVVNYSLTMGLLWTLLHLTAQTFLSQVWRALFLFHGIRLFQFATRVYKTTWKDDDVNHTNNNNEPKPPLATTKNAVYPSS